MFREYRCGCSDHSLNGRNDLAVTLGAEPVSCVTWLCLSFSKDDKNNFNDRWNIWLNTLECVHDEVSYRCHKTAF